MPILYMLDKDGVMDNQEQLSQMEKFHERMQKEVCEDLDFNTAAQIWIKRYGQIWRSIKRLSNTSHA